MKAGGDLYLLKEKLVTFDRASSTRMNESGSFLQV